MKEQKQILRRVVLTINRIGEASMKRKASVMILGFIRLPEHCNFHPLPSLSTVMLYYIFRLESQNGKMQDIRQC